MRFSNPYRTYVMRRLQVKILMPWHLNKVIDLLAMKKELSHAGKPGFLKSPLRAIRYTVAGGSSVFGKKRPSNPIFGRDFDGVNPYNKKIIMMDEFHNLIKPHDSVKKYKSKLNKLKHALYEARGSVIVGLTATPIVDSIKDADEILRVIKGKEYQGKNNEGFLSYFQTMPPSVFPRVESGNPSKNFIMDDDCHND